MSNSDPSNEIAMIKKATYVRVSTDGQNTGRQEEIIQGKAYIEKISGRTPLQRENKVPDYFEM